MKINLLIGDKSQIYKKEQQGTGEGRHHEFPFFELLKNKVQFNIVPMYSSKLPLPSRLSHIAHHFIHPFSLNKHIDRNAITHIMFGEESSILKLKKPSKKTIVTCLDLIPILHPEGLSKPNQIFQKWCLSGLKKADHIIANSEFTKAQIQKAFKIPKEKITVIYPAISKNIKPLSGIPSEFFTKYHINPRKEYLLYIGALDLPRKNLKTLLSAFAKITAKKPQLDLILIGHSYNKERLKQLLIPHESIANRIHIFQNISNKDLPLFYNLAKLFIFPSLYEGFGLPPAEAMACGTPVITSNATSLPEVAGDAAIQAPCIDPEHLAKKIITTLESPELLELLSQKGPEQSKKFTWELHTKKTHDLYEKLSNE